MATPSKLPPVPPLTKEGFNDPVWLRWLRILREQAASVVSSIQIALTNGFSGVSTSVPGTNDIIVTLETTVNGLVRGSGGALDATVIGPGLSFDGVMLSAAPGVGVPAQQSSFLLDTEWDDGILARPGAAPGMNMDLRSVEALNGPLRTPTYIDFALAQAPTPAVGRVWQDGGTTLNLGMTANVVGKLCESNFFYVKANAAMTLGQLCRYAGAVGASGTILAEPVPAGETSPTKIIGFAAEDIPLNGFGLVQILGVLRGFDTTGSVYGEVWADGTILYYNPTAGGITKNFPASGPIVSLGAVVNAGAGGSGSVMIRPTAVTRIIAGTGITVTQTAAGAVVSL